MTAVTVDTELKESLKRLERKLYVTYSIGLLILFLLSLISNFALKEQAAGQAVSLIKRMVGRGDYRETIYTLNDAKLDHFAAVVYYKEDGQRMFSLPAQLDPLFVMQNGLLSKLLYSKLRMDLFFDKSKRHKTGSVLFIFGRFAHTPYAVMIWLFFLFGTLPFVRLSRLRVIENYHKYIALMEEATRADLARRVRHDIRSPLGALQIATQSLSLNSKQQAIIRRATERISEIVSELELIRVIEPRDLGAFEKTTVEPILSITQEIIQEKRTQLTGRKNIAIIPHFCDDSFFLFAELNGAEFKRSLSNIIDNAIDACEGSGKIVVTIRGQDDSIYLDVSDNGIGISRQNLERVKDKGFSNKRHGTGLGLYYANKTIEQLGGSLTLSSQEQVGTTVSISIPACKPPAWYVRAVNIPKDGVVAILDDQESTHLSWRARLDELKDQGESFSIFEFRNAVELKIWYQDFAQTSKNEILYLLDYDLGEGKQNGLNLAMELGILSDSILVTGHFDSVDLQKQCAEQKISLLPKSFLSLIELRCA